MFQMQQGRRTASLKASYEAVSKSVELTKELALGREHASSSRSAAVAPTSEPSVPKAAGRNKKYVICEVEINKKCLNGLCFSEKNGRAV